MPTEKRVRRLIVSLVVMHFLALVAGAFGAQGPARVEKAVEPTAPDTTLPRLTRIAQIRDLSPSEAARGYPVRVTGVLTYYDTADYKQFLQDESAGIYFSLRTTNLDVRLAHGRKVEIEGYSGPGGYAPLLHATRISVMGDGPFPPARVSTVQSLMSGSEDSQWVVLKGVVRSQTVVNDNTVLMLWTTDASLKVTVPNATAAPAPMDFLDAVIEVHGVCTTIFNERRQVQGASLHVPGWKQVEVHEMGPKDPFTLPVQPISALLEFHAGTSGLHRSRVQGIVTLRRSDGSFFIQDASDGMLIQPKESNLEFPVGSSVAIVGFPTVMEKLLVLQDAVAKPLSDLLAIQPATLKPESLLSETFHATLVQFDGRVIAHSTRAAEEILTVESGQSVTDVILEKGTAKAQLDKIVPGSVVRLTGVYVAQLDDSRKVRSFRLLLRSPADVVLISRPPWWTLRNTLWVLGGLAAVLSGALMWVSLLRRQVRRRTMELSGEIEGHQRTENKLEHQTGLLVAEVARRKHAQTELEEKQAALKKEIDERKLSEAALRDSDEKFRQLAENITDAFWIRSPDMREVHYISPAFERIWGRSMNSLYVNPGQWADAIVLEDRERVLALFTTLTAAAPSISVEYRIARPDGEVRWVHARGFQVRNAGNELVRLSGIVTDITERKLSEAALEKAHKEFVEVSRQAGMAEVATGVLHNVGNVLNSVNVASSCVADSIRKSKAANLSKVVALLRGHEADLGAFFAHDPKGKQLPAYLAQLAEHLAGEQATALIDLAGLQKNIEHIKDIVAMQQSFGKVSGVKETLAASDLVEDALKMNSTSLVRHDIEVIREFGSVPPLSVEKHKVLQILVNLIRNAKYACDETGRADKRLTIRVANSDGRVRIAVTDNGVGIPPDNLTRIFAHGFTTKKDGHGFGLHSGALAAKEMGGCLTAHSDGPGCGSRFTLELPLQISTHA